MLIAADLSLQFMKLGHHVVGIHSFAEDAYKTIAFSRPDVVVLNLGSSPLTDGLVTGHNLVDQFQIPVIFLSAHVDSQTLKQAMAIGPHGFICKPIDQQELQQTLREVQLRLVAERKL